MYVLCYTRYMFVSDVGILAVFCGNDYCSYLLKTWNNWFEASEKCKKFHSDLVSVRDASENEWIINEILAKLGVDRVHLGTFLAHFNYRWIA